MDTLKVIEVYQNCKSLKRIAAELNLSEVKVRRILITAGLWRSKTSDAVKELLDQNLTVAEVAEKLCMSEKNVQAYMPYRKGTYDAEYMSDSAIRSRLYRNRCQTAAANQINHSPVKADRTEIIHRNLSQTVHLHLALNIDGMSLVQYPYDFRCAAISVLLDSISFLSINNDEDIAAVVGHCQGTVVLPTRTSNDSLPCLLRLPQ